MMFTRRFAVRLLAGGTVAGAFPLAARAQAPRSYSPAAEFLFRVNLAGAPDADAMAFQEISGLFTEFTAETFSDGGDNRFIHALPKSPSKPKLVLKRGVGARNSELAKWFTDTLDPGLSARVVTHDLDIALVNADGSVVMLWRLQAAWPVKWDVPSTTPDNKSFVIRAMVFAYATAQQSIPPAALEQ